MLADRYSREDSEFDRAIGFIDATFALALTLLITTLEIDDKPSSFTSPSALADAVGPQFIAFVIAFAVIAGYWLLHHRMVSGFVALDRPAIVANLFLIGSVVLLPFSTESVGDPDVDDLALPTVLMAVNIALVSALTTVVWVVAARRGLLDHRASAGEWRERLVGAAVPIAVFLASVPIAYLISPSAARASWAALLVVNPAVGTLMARATRRTAGEK